MAHNIIATTTSLGTYVKLPQAGSGGTESETISGGVKYAVHTFTSTGNTNFVLTRPVSGLQLLMVAGGGGGGTDNSGGGGAGGLAYYGTETPTNRTTPNGGNQTWNHGTYVVTVGSGGNGGGNVVNTAASNGTDSQVNGPSFNQTVKGGGAGGTGNTNMYDGNDGGSGGGAAHETVQGSEGSGNLGGNVGNAVQGFDGGAGADGAGGGGGGAGAVGQAGDVRGDKLGGQGGVGLEYSISGTAQFYAAGGGGGNENHVYNQAARASGIGGQTNPSQNQPCTDGVVNTGSGGGGVTHPTVAANGTYAGNGASGIVIIRYPL